MKALEELRKEGKTRHVGISNYTAYELREARKGAPITANQVGYNLFDRPWERHMFPTAQELGIGIMAYGPMAHGMLTGTMTADTQFGSEDWRRHGMLFGQRIFGPNLAQNVKIPDDALARIEEIMQGAAGQVDQVPGRHHQPPEAA
jgi:hypothetical protein